MTSQAHNGQGTPEGRTLYWVGELAFFLGVLLLGGALIGYDVLGFLGFDAPPTDVEVAIERLEDLAPFSSFEQRELARLVDDPDVLVERLRDVR